MYFVELSQHSQKFIEKLEIYIKNRVETTLKRLENNPVPSDSKFIGRDDENNKIFRYRIGDYRCLYSVHEDRKYILIIKIDKRPRVYN